MKLNELEDFPELGNTVVIDGIEYVKKREPLSNIDIKEASRKAKDMSFYNGVKWAERQHGIGGGGMSKEREFLKKLRYASLLENDLRKELDELLAQPEQTEQEPVATKLESHQFTAFHVSALDFKKLQKLPTGTKIYTTPPKRKPLSNEEVIAKYKDIALDNPLYVPSYYAGFRDAEQAHGIGGGE